METLVEQGIVPGYKTNPSLHMQKTKLERAKMGDMLRSKISHRPERAELVHRHILEVNSKIIKYLLILYVISGCSSRY